MVHVLLVKGAEVEAKTLEHAILNNKKYVKIGILIFHQVELL